MTVLVIEVEGLALPGLLGDDLLVNLRHLLEAGCHGELAMRESAGDSARARDTSRAGEDGPAIRHMEVRPSDWREFDDQLGGLLARLEEGSAVLIHSRPNSAEGFFLMAGDRVPSAGRVEGISFEDLAPAILRLAGIEGVEPSPLSRLLGEGTAPLATDELAEAIIQERLRGLGYIA